MGYLDDLKNLDLKELDLKETFSNIDWEHSGEWPVAVKATTCVIIFIAILIAGWYIDVTAQRDTLILAESKEPELIGSLEIKQRKAASLDELKEQLEEMEQTFGDVLQQLPDRAEVAALLVDISQTGVAAGLEFQLFKPQNEIPAEFYAELPIEIKVLGNYHQFGEFISGLASQPRIVTTHNIVIDKQNAANDSGRNLMMTMLAKTYRAINEEENLEEGGE